MNRSGPEHITVAEFHERCRGQGVTDHNHIAFVCPICGTIQSMASLIRAGAIPDQAERMIGFSCEGRLTGVGPYPHGKSARDQARRRKRGCDWTLGGLFRVHQLVVIDSEGNHHPRFVFATPEQAKALELAAGPL